MEKQTYNLFDEPIRPHFMFNQLQIGVMYKFRFWDFLNYTKILCPNNRKEYYFYFLVSALEDYSAIIKDIKYTQSFKDKSFMSALSNYFIMNMLLHKKLRDNSDKIIEADVTFIRRSVKLFEIKKIKIKSITNK